MKGLDRIGQRISTGLNRVIRPRGPLGIHSMRIRIMVLLALTLCVPGCLGSKDDVPEQVNNSDPSFLSSLICEDGVCDLETRGGDGFYGVPLDAAIEFYSEKIPDIVEPLLKASDDVDIYSFVCEGDRLADDNCGFEVDDGYNYYYIKATDWCGYLDDLNALIIDGSEWAQYYVEGGSCYGENVGCWSDGGTYGECPFEDDYWCPTDLSPDDGGMDWEVCVTGGWG